MSPHMNGSTNGPGILALQRKSWLLALVAIAMIAAVLSMAGLTSKTAVSADTLQPSSAQMAGMPATSTAAAASATPAATTIAASTAASATPAAATETTVKIQNYAFSPASLTIKVGTKVTWTNLDTAPHTVTVSSGPVKFASPNLQKGQSFSYTFTKAGTYSYYCAVHPDMKATVTATGDTTTPPTTDPTDPTMPMPSTGACGGALTSVDALLQHVYSGHLEEGVGQQVGDILSTDQYIKTHLGLVENMLKPLVGGESTC